MPRRLPPASASASAMDMTDAHVERVAPIWSAPLSRLRDRAAAAVGNAYARAALALLTERERLADLNAERRFARRAASAHPQVERAAASGGPDAASLPSIE
jgi:hypothetical protein